MDENFWLSNESSRFRADIDSLKDLNFSETKDLDEADLVLFNTCAVRDLSNNKFYSQLGEIKHAKKEKKMDSL